MTPDEQLYRDLWLAELWATVPEYHAPRQRPRVVRKAGEKRQKRAA